MRIGLLECDDVAGRFANVQGGYREMFAGLLPGFDFRFYESHRGQMPASPGECDAWMCTGSKYSVYERLAWVERLSGFIREIHGEQKPFVGICFGHQLLAHALGGEVARAGYGWGVGVLPVEVIKPEPWMAPPKREVRLQHSHQDQVQKLPPGSVLLGRSPHCDIGMFRVGQTMLGIEGHPEFTPQFGAALISLRREKIGVERAQQALESLQGPCDGALVGRWIARFIAGEF
ncbi:MAG: type 1 glutamine amidotransferase [Betaproteobacteria bacterium]